MPGADKKEGKKATKLSLRKKSRRPKASTDKLTDDVQNVLRGKVDLNETCEFRQPLKFPGCGDNKLKPEKDRKPPSTRTAVTAGDTMEGLVVCQVCNKNVDHMSVQRREQHVNRCIDRVEAVDKLKREEYQLLESARTVVLDCPMCGKCFKSENARLVHLKKCSQSFGVPTDKMIRLVKDQEQVRTEQLAVGLIPTQLRSKLSKSVATHKRKLKEPKSKYEEDVQVAMAISSSLAPKELLNGATCAGSDGKKRKTKKAVLEDVCLLTTLSMEDRQRRTEEKVSNILHVVPYPAIWTILDCFKHIYMRTNKTYFISVSNIRQAEDVASLCKSSLKAGTQNDSCSLWDMCSRDLDTYSNQLFYVEALVPPLSMSKSEPGKNLRRLSSIPGREKSFLNCTDHMKEMCIPGSTDMSIDDIITASTQTAVVLAELAVDDTDIQHSLVCSQITPNLVQPVDLEASGFCVEKMVLNNIEQEAFITATLSDFKTMINNEKYSDVKVASVTGQIFYAHKTILAARCPRLMQMMADSVINLDAPPDVLLSFLTFLYTGEVTVSSSAQSELLNLAQKLDLPPLVNACNKLELCTENLENAAFTDNPESSETEFVESQLNVKEIWGESDSDVDLDENDRSGDKENHSCSEINVDDYRDIICTQNRKLKEKFGIEIDDAKEVDNNADRKLKSHYQSVEELTKLKNRVTEDLDVGDQFCSDEEVALSMTNHEHLENVDLSSDDMDVDIIDSPKPKHIGLSSELDVDGTKDVIYNRIRKNLNELVYEVDTGQNGGVLEVDTSDYKVNNDVDVTHVGNASIEVNSSTADLFGSPTPKKLNDTFHDDVDLGNEISVHKNRRLHSSSKFSTPLEYKFNSRRTLNSSSVSITPVVCLNVDYNSYSSDNLNDSKNETGAEINNLEEFRESVEIDRDEYVENEVYSTIGVDKCGQNEFVTTESSDCSELGSSDDDIQITGDNFNELSQQSPTFRNSSSIGKLHVSQSGQAIDKTTYLGLKSLSSVPRLLTNEFDEYTGSMPKFSRNDICQNKNEVDSDSEVIETIETEDSDISDDHEQNVNKEINGDGGEHTGIFSNARSSISYRNTKESFLSASLSKGGRKYMSYGKHDISVYSCDGDNVTAEDRSVGANHTDTWDDFDDCGVGYEPPPASPGETSPLVPKQDDMIDLSRNEDDDNACGDQVDNDVDIGLLEDGDDSFVFKVNEDVHDQPSSRRFESKNHNFKTPTMIERQVNKRPWVLPSPFTPMPQYVGMPTPALKRAMQGYGVKPVGKKRMVKMLEDIYHQTHQYETDSEVEDESETREDVLQPLGGAGTDISQPVVVASSDGEDLPSNQTDVSCSQNSDISDVLEESCMHMSSDSDTTSSPQKNIDVTRKLFDFIKSRQETHLKILMYEPLELDVLKKDVKEAGIKCSMDKLMDFLDEKCIAFTNKNTRKRQPAKKGRQKTTKVKQTVK